MKLKRLSLKFYSITVQQEIFELLWDFNFAILCMHVHVYVYVLYIVVKFCGL